MDDSGFCVVCGRTDQPLADGLCVECDVVIPIELAGDVGRSARRTEGEALPDELRIARRHDDLGAHPVDAHHDPGIPVYGHGRPGNGSES